MEFNIVKQELSKEFKNPIFEKKVEISKVFDGKTKVFYSKSEDILYINYVKDCELLRAFFECFQYDFSSDFEFEIKSLIDISFMVDLARNNVLKVEAMKKIIRYIALMGYSALDLYLEDCFEVDNEPYFGYLRGRYSKDELKEIIEYAEIFGLKVVPYIQTLAHLNAIKYWPVYREHFDIDDIVLIDDPRIYELIENMIKTISEIFHTDKIHIGMDEAFHTGRGKYLDKNGYFSRSELIFKHLKKVLEIVKKYGYKAEMWSDMFFSGGSYATPYVGHAENDEIDEDLTLVFWDYDVREKEVFEKRLDSHLELTKNVIAAGGTWGWIGFAPNNLWGIENTKSLMDVAIEKNLKEYVLTSWKDNGGETSFFASLPTMNYVGNFAYHKASKEDSYMFKYISDIDFNTFMKLDELNKSTKEFNVSTKSTVSRIYFYNDILLGKFDSCLAKNQAKYFKNFAKELSSVDFSLKFGEIFKVEYDLANVLAIKCDIGIKIRNAYQNKDKAELEKLVKKLVKLKKLVKIFYEDFFAMWHLYSKGQGFDVQDLRIGGLLQRIDTSIKLIKMYLNNEIENIEELDEKLLDFWGNLNKFKVISALNEMSYLNIAESNVNW